MLKKIGAYIVAGVIIIILLSIADLPDAWMWGLALAYGFGMSLVVMGGEK